MVSLGFSFSKSSAEEYFIAQGVEARNLIIGFVRGNISAGRKFILDYFDAIGRDAVLREPVEVSVLIDGGGNHRALAQ